MRLVKAAEIADDVDGSAELSREIGEAWRATRQLDQEIALDVGGDGSPPMRVQSPPGNAWGAVCHGSKGGRRGRAYPSGRADHVGGKVGGTDGISMKGSFAKIFGRRGVGERAPPSAAVASGRQRRRCPARSGDRLRSPRRCSQSVTGHRKAEIEADRHRASRARRRPDRRATPNGACMTVKVVMISRQMCSTVASGRRPVAQDEAAHHVGFAVGAEGRAGLAQALGCDQLGDHAGALDQQPVHRLVDRVDPVADRLSDRAPACPLSSSSVRGRARH